MRYIALFFNTFIFCDAIDIELLNISEKLRINYSSDLQLIISLDLIGFKIQSVTVCISYKYLFSGFQGGLCSTQQKIHFFRNKDKDSCPCLHYFIMLLCQMSSCPMSWYSRRIYHIILCFCRNCSVIMLIKLEMKLIVILTRPHAIVPIKHIVLDRNHYIQPNQHVYQTSEHFAHQN